MGLIDVRVGFGRGSGGVCIWHEAKSVAAELLNRLSRIDSTIAILESM